MCNVKKDLGPCASGLFFDMLVWMKPVKWKRLTSLKVKYIMLLEEIW